MQNAQRLFVAALVAIVLSVVVWKLDRVTRPVPQSVPGPSDLSSDQHHPELVGIAPRSKCWHKARADFIADHPDCAACGTMEDCEVHHVRPFHEVIADPATAYLECDPSNLITLCRQHHFELGHRCSTGKSNWGLCSNPNVRDDAAKWRREHKLPPPSPLR